MLNSTSVSHDDVILSIPQHAEIPKLSLEPTFLEVVNSVKQISSGKAPGRDVVPHEIYKHGGEKLFKKLHDLFINIWVVDREPQNFKDASIQHLYKNKGYRNVCDNHCGI
uniref:Uncharacterized protein n=1 Tax=Octopus bimaculoides TaxID=37653 RepID=A0A0L8GQJ8_OCTBM